MCGISGIISFHCELQKLELEILVKKMADTMLHRGPDAEGVWISEDSYCAFSHRRLSIIDVSEAGKQPMQSYDGRFVITFNGEIYNFLELKPELEKKGSKFKTHTDTEVLIEAIRHYGEDAFLKLDGMYAFVVYDTFKKEVLVGRDPFGEKPLYYIHTDKYFAFASELRALRVLPFFQEELSEEAIPEYLCFQYIGAPRTLYKNVYKLEPAHYIKISREGKFQKLRYYSFEPKQVEAIRKIQDYADELEELLVKSIKRRLISDVPLGAFLSGGVDSSTVVGIIAKRFNKNIKTFTIGFENSPDSEHITARKFAQYLGADHYEKILTSDAAWFLDNVGKILDEPNADSSCLPTYLISQFAKEKVTVAVSGDGGDELFAAYRRYFLTLEEIKNLEYTELGLGEIYYSDKILVFDLDTVFSLLGYLPYGFYLSFSELKNKLRNNFYSALNLLRKTDIENYMPGAVLPKVDRMSMQHSLEVRTPYLSLDIAKFAENLPEEYLYQSGKGKLILREVAYRYLPKELIDLPKKGFGLPLSGAWGKEELNQILFQSLSSKNSKLKNIFHLKGLYSFVKTQKENFSLYRIWSLLVLENYLKDKDFSYHKKENTTYNFSYFSFKPYQLNDKKDNKVIVFFNTYLVPFWINFIECKKVFISKFELNLKEINYCLDYTNPKNYNLLLEILKKEGLSETLLFCHELDIRLFNFLLVHLAFKKVRLFFLVDGNLMSIVLKKSLLFLWFTLKLRSIFFRKKLNFLMPVRLIKLFTKVLFPDSKLFYISNPRKEEGFAYFYHIPAESKLGEDGTSSYFFENGNLSLYPASSHDDIRFIGWGRYSIWNGCLFFSGFDNQVGIKSKEYFVLKFSQDLFSKNKKANDEEKFLNKLESLIKTLPKEISPTLKNKKVILLTRGLSSGGAERQWCYLAKVFQENGYEPIVVLTSSQTPSNSHYLNFLISHEIPYIYLGDEIVDFRFLLESRYLEISKFIPYRFYDQNFNIFNLFKLLAFLIKEQPYILLAQLDSINIIGAVAGLLTDIPKIVISFRNYNPTNFHYLKSDSDWYYNFYKVLISSRLLLTGNSTKGNEDYANWLNIPPEKIFLLKNIVSLDLLQEQVEQKDIRKEFNLSKDYLLVLGIFRLSDEKRPLLFLRVAKEVLRKKIM